MSQLTNFLQQYSQDISARAEHQNDADTAVADRKANTLEEKFQNAKDAIEAGGAELGGAGAAFHLGRKVYRQIQTRRAARQSQLSEANSNAADQQPRLQTNTGNQETRPATGETDDPAPVEPEPLARGGRASARPKLDPIEEDPAELPSGQVLARPTPPPSRQAQAAEEARDPATAIDPAAEAHGGGNAPATESSDPATLNGVNDRAAATQSRIGNDLPDDTGSAPDFLQREGTALKESPGTTTSSANDAPSASPATEQPPAQNSAKPVTETETDALPDAPNPTGAAGRAATNTAEQVAADGKTAIADTGENALKSVGTKVAQKVGTGGALEGVGDVLDMLGPIGEGLGIITSLVGLFEGMGHKAEDPDADVAKAQQTGQYAAGAVGSGLDTKALTSQPTGAMTATY
jgi:hypothetical protein